MILKNISYIFTCLYHKFGENTFNVIIFETLFDGKKKASATFMKVF